MGLAKCAPNSKVTRIRCDHKRTGKVWQGQDWCACQGGFQTLKRLLLGRAPDKGNVLCKQTQKGFCQVCEPGYKLMIVVAEAQELLQGFYVCGCPPRSNGFYLVPINLQTATTHDVAQVLYSGFCERALGTFQKQFVFVQSLENPSQMSLMFSFVCRKHKYVVQVDQTKASKAE